MYTVVNTYPKAAVNTAKNVKVLAAKVVYEELLKYLNQKM